MSTHKAIDKICVAVTVLALIITIVFMNGSALGIEVVTDEDAERNEGSTWFTANDQDGSWSTDGACVITLNGTGAEISGDGAYFSDGSTTIKNAGKYVISGSLDDGSIIVDSYQSSKVWIMLDNISINCEDNACVIVNQADKVFLTLAEGSVNTMTSGSEYSSQALADNTGGVIFTHDDLTINGSGSLRIVSSYKHGIDANDSLVVTGGTIDITCPQDAVHANDEVSIMEASLTISSGDDAIHSDSSFYMASGTVLINECYEGIEALSIEVDGGDITIYSSDDGMNANGESEASMNGMVGTGGGPMGGDGSGGPMGGDGSGDVSVSGDGSGDGSVSSDGSGGGSVSSDGSGDGSVSGDSMRGDTSDNGSAGQTQNTDASVSSDIATDENGDNKTSGSENSDSEETYIRINGGNVTIINETGRDADGLDSNGSIYINGGTVLICLPGSGGNCALDYGTESGGVLEVNGGTLIGCGDSSMAEEFSDTSSQSAVLYNIGVTMEAGTVFTVSDSSGNEILRYAPEVSYNSVAFSSPELKIGQTYTAAAGDTSAEITLESTASTLGEASGMGGGRMGGGHMGGGHMGGGFGQSRDSSAEDTASFQAASGEGSTDGSAPPQMGNGDGATDGSAPPQMGNGDGATDGSAPPQMSSGDGAADGSASAQMAVGHGGMGGQHGDSVDSDSSEETVSTASDVRELSSEVWVMLASSAAALCAGLVAVILFRKN